MDQLIGLINDMGKSSRTRSLSDGGTQDDDEGKPTRSSVFKY